MLAYCMFDLLFNFLLKSSQQSSNKAPAFTRRVLTEVFLSLYAAKCTALLSYPCTRSIVYAHSNLPFY